MAARPWGEQRPDCRRRDPEHLAGVLAPVVEEIHEHERGALSVREPSERADHLVSKVRGGEGILGLAGCQGPLRGEREPPKPAPRRIERGPIQLPGWVVDAVPPFEDMEEGVLHQLLSLVGVPDDQVEGTVERCVFIPRTGPRRSTDLRSLSHSQPG